MTAFRSSNNPEFYHSSLFITWFVHTDQILYRLDNPDMAREFAGDIMLILKKFGATMMCRMVMFTTHFIEHCVCINPIVVILHNTTKIEMSLANAWIDRYAPNPFHRICAYPRVALHMMNADDQTHVHIQALSYFPMVGLENVNGWEVNWALLLNSLSLIQTKG